MLVRLILILTLVPLVELFILFRVAAWIQPGPTVALVLLTGVLGATLARRQGIKALSEVHEQLSHGIMPGDVLVNGLLILVAGLLLVTPGILTDLCGFALLIPPLRTRVQRGLIRYFKGRMVRIDEERPEPFVDVVATSCPDVKGGKSNVTVWHAVEAQAEDC